MKTTTLTIALTIAQTLLLTACNTTRTTKTHYSNQTYTLPNATIKTPTIINKPKHSPPQFDYFQLTKTPNLPNIAFRLNNNKPIHLNKITPKHITDHLIKTIKTSHSATINTICHQQINDFNLGKTNSLYLIFNPNNSLNYKFTFKDKKITALTFTLSKQMPFYAYNTKAWYPEPINQNQANNIFGSQGKHASYSKTITKTTNH